MKMIIVSQFKIKLFIKETLNVNQLISHIIKQKYNNNKNR